MQLLFSGPVPLFVCAHFGYHVVGAILRPMMPMIRADFSLSYTQAGIIISAFAITSGISQLPAGWMADRVGPRIMILLSISGVALAGLLMGLSRSYWSLVVFLVLAALLGGGYHPAAASSIAAAVPADNRGSALGMHTIGGSCSYWMAPLLAAQIALVWGWRGAYITLSAPLFFLGIILYTLIGRYMRANSGQHQKTTDEAMPAPDRTQWRKLVLFIVMSVTNGTMMQSVNAYLPLYAVDQLGAAEVTAARLMAITPVVGLVVAPSAGYLTDRFGAVRVLAAASLLIIPAVYLMGIVTGLAGMAAVMVVFGIFSYTRMPTSEFYIIEHTPAERRATVLGFYFLAGSEMA
ncbi:MAG: MFS transporter, partial [Deltaproteobacteria bacterium]|nr:MFS transporter [Deltaproteobacteria bacterium]